MSGSARVAVCHLPGTGFARGEHPQGELRALNNTVGGKAGDKTHRKLHSDNTDDSYFDL